MTAAVRYIDGRSLDRLIASAESSSLETAERVVSVAEPLVERMTSMPGPQAKIAFRQFELALYQRRLNQLRGK